MKNILLVLGILVCVVGGVVGGIYLYNHGDVYFSGKEVFLTHEDYTAFKIEVGKRNVQLRDVVVLSSELPVVVDFEVLVPYSYDFLYGERTGTEGSWVLMMFLVVPIAIMAKFLFPASED